MSKLAAFQSYTSALSPSGYRRDGKSSSSFKEAHFAAREHPKAPRELDTCPVSPNMYTK